MYLCNSSEGYNSISRIRNFDSTPCYENLNLIILPSIGFLLLSIYDISQSLKYPINNKPNNRSKFFIKLFSYFSSNLLLILQLFYNFDYDIETLSQLCQFISITISSLISIIHHNRFNKPSTLLLIYYPIIILSNLIKIRTSILSSYGDISINLLISTTALTAFIWLVETSGPGFPPSNDPLNDASIYSLYVHIP